MSVNQKFEPIRGGIFRDSVKRYKAILSLLILAPGGLEAEPVNSLHETSPSELERRVYRLETLVQTALRDNPGLQGARTVLDAARERIGVAGRLENPSLSLSYADDSAFNSEGEMGYEIGFAQKFPITRRLQLDRWIAEDALALAEAEIAERERKLRTEVEFAVFALAEANAHRERLDRLIELNRKSLRFIESRVELGEASEVDVNRIRLEIYSLEQTLRQAQNRAVIQEATLLELCALPESTRIQLDFHFEAPSEVYALPALTNDALEAHPSYVVAQRMLQLAEKNLSLAQAGRWGDIEVEFFFEEERGVDEPGGLGRDRFFGIGLSVPLPIYDQNQFAVAERRSDRDRLRWELRGIESSLRHAASAEREIAARISAEVVDSQRELIAVMESNLEVMNDAYTAGQVSLTDLFRTQEQNLRIQSTQLALLRELAESLSRWRAATGLTLP